MNLEQNNPKLYSNAQRSNQQQYILNQSVNL